MMIWIEDNTSQLADISESLFPTLWEHDVCNEIILVGDNYREEIQEANRDDFVDNLYDNITDLFYQFCYEKKGDKKSLDEYYDDKEGIIPRKLRNLPDNSSHDEVVKIVDSLIQNSKTGDIVVVGIDIGLNKNNSETKETLTDKILHKLLNKSEIKVFIYSHYNLDEYPDTRDFKKKYENSASFFNEKRLVTEDSDEQKKFFGFFGVKLPCMEEKEDVNLAK